MNEKEKRVDSSSEEDLGQRADLIDIAAGIAMAAMSLIALIWVIPNYVEVGTSDFDIGPAFFPNFTATLVLGLSALLIVTRAIRYTSGNPGLPGKVIVFEIALWAVISVSIIPSFAKLGFLLTATLIIGAGVIMCGYRVWWVIALLAVVFPLIIDQAAWFIFTVDLP